ncbi:MAG: FkbM family methyltransferase [Flavobacteriales bacterium]|nr:FkbM family methyltransferase [Flavobacteriales bacterium]
MGMSKGAKQVIRKILNGLHLDLTRNLKYDRLTLAIMKRELKSGSNCIDIGCHEGEMLEYILQFAPQGVHFAFEPIPAMFDALERKFGKQVTVYPYALSSSRGETTFHHVRNAPAYSGIRKRDYATDQPDVQLIQVKMERLDDLIEANQKIDFIKLDVEGAEYLVLQGARETIRRCKPLILFEFGLGASNHYDTTPLDMWKLLVDDCKLRIFTLEAFIKHDTALTLQQLQTCYQSNAEYYFVASV